MDYDKQAVKDFWEDASCGERLYLDGRNRQDFLNQSDIRYRLEPYILDFAEFDKHGGKKVLEIDVGLGADHQKFAEAGAELYGVDLTQRALGNTQARFVCMDLATRLSNVDAEKLPFIDNAFDLVYSWGVLHVTPDTPAAIDEVYRVLKPGGEARIMIYHTYSMVGYMLWVRYALMRLQPWKTLGDIYFNYLESRGTKAYTIEEARELFQKFKNPEFHIYLTHGDLLTSAAGQRHEGVLLDLARTIWPRRIIRKYFKNHGLFLTIRATK
ncbi:hypothetical protein D3OALGA1CA_397 [Olavius algarvensis associated proteobacterium Delta 3]|nr:hypothetical protein D3OALGA1CA_397 [Olavius algarvensis associated proteobacterium Delta 3]CAB5113669.1 hypothetical protein D3OALGB2SA_2539 [Olavius algarvensis associated proteobacterium Delta 3]